MTPNYGIAPDGTQTSTRIQAPGSYLFAGSGPHSGTNVGSIWAKAPTSGTFQFRLGGVYQTVKVSTVWQRLYFSATGDGTHFLLFELPADIEFWGAQLESGTFPSSYIPTSGASGTRAADVASVDVTKLFNETEGTLIVEADFGPLSGAYNTAAQFSPGFVQIYRQPSGSLVFYGDAMPFVALSNSETSHARVALSYSTGVKSSANSSAVVSSVRNPGFTPTALKLGINSSGGEPLNGTIQYLAYLPFAMDDFTLKASSELE
jgi:hypothetical protein